MKKKMEAIRVIWIEGKVINFFTYILFYMKKFEAIGVTCKTDITASKKNLVFLKLETYSKIYIDSTFKKQFIETRIQSFQVKSYH